MDRRDALAGAGASVSLWLAGCLDTLADGRTEIVDVDLETGIETDTRASDDPTVGFEDDAIGVIGTYSIGNSCYDERLEEPTYDPADDELRIALTREHDGSDGCDDIDQQISYRVTVRVEGDLPGTVTVTEDRGGETTAERGFDPLPW